jgi:hypothetical protein
MNIPCQCCRKELPRDWPWTTCDQCGYRICSSCIGVHRGQYGSGFKCSQCAFGHMKMK